METVDDALVSFSKLYHNICGSRSDNLNSEATQDSLPRISLQVGNECNGKATINFILVKESMVLMFFIVIP